MNEDVILKMAQMQTLLDAIVLLVELRSHVDPSQYQKIDDMVQRLTTMSSSLRP